MSRIEWRVDAGTQVVVRHPPFGRRRVEYNGQPVPGTWRSKRFEFTLPDGRQVAIVLKADSLSRQTELLLDGKYIPDTRRVPKELRCPACQSEIQLLDEYCSQCGHALGSPSRFMHLHSVQGATKAIYALAILYALFGVVLYVLMRDTALEALDKLAAFDDADVLDPIDGVTYTAGELRRQVIWEHRGILVQNLILSGLMLALAWWSRRKPLAAILIATAIFVALQVVNAIIAPQTLAQGVIVKVIIMVVLARGIKGALDMRAGHG